MSTTKRALLTLAILSVLIVFFYEFVKNIAEQLPIQRFAVTVVNESDHDIVDLETGIISQNSKHAYGKTIVAGKTAKFSPNLQLTGEGAIYLKFTDSSGNAKETVVCGYTEYLSGSSQVTIHNDKVDVQQDCM